MIILWSINWNRLNITIVLQSTFIIYNNELYLIKSSQNVFVKKHQIATANRFVNILYEAKTKSGLFTQKDKIKDTLKKLFIDFY